MSKTPTSPTTRPAIWVAMPIIRAIVISAARHGMNIREHTHFMGVNMEDFYRDDTFTNLEQSCRLWEYCRQRGDLSLAMQIAQTYSVLSIGGLGLLVNSSPNVLTAARETARLSSAVTMTNFYKFEEVDDKVIFTTGLAEQWEHLYPETALWNVVFSQVQALQSIAKSTGHFIRPLSAHIRYRRPAEAIDFRHYYQAELMFGQTENCLVFQRQDLLAPVAGHNPTLFSTAKNMLEQDLEKQKKEALYAYETRRLILQHFSMMQPRLEDVADLLHLSPRSLQRRLQEEGLSFQKIADEVKSQLAVGLLKKASASVNEVAYQLGYDDPNVFRRAFKRWTGVNPGEVARIKA